MMPTANRSGAFAGSLGTSVSCKIPSEHIINQIHSEMVNRALAQIVRRWRTYGLTLQEAQYQADQFARHFTQAAVR